MPVQGLGTVTAPQGGKEWKPVPEDIYQVVIKDIDEKDMKKYQSEEMETFYHFKFVILDGTGDAEKAQVSAFATMKWFGGSKKASPSKLVTIVKAVYAHYYPDLSVIELEAEDMTFQVINDLIGKQLRVAVKLNNEGTNNKTTEFMGIKQELTVPDDVVINRPPKTKTAPPGGEAPKEDPDDIIEVDDPDKKKDKKAKEAAKDVSSDDIPF